jgi:ribonuclease Z
MLRLRLPTSWGELLVAGGSRAGGRLLVPAALVARVEDLLATCARLEGGKPYGVTISAVSPGDRVILRNDFALRFFATSHWVETLGCCVEWTRKRLLPELAGAPPEELRQLREAGSEITRQMTTDLLAYLADTGPEVFEREPWLANAEVLIVECTFLRPADRERARRFGHLHLEDLVRLAPRLSNRHLVLTHLSRRHRLTAGARAIRDALADRLSPALHFLNLEWL